MTTAEDVMQPDKLYSYDSNTSRLYISKVYCEPRYVRIPSISLRGCWCNISKRGLVICGGRDTSSSLNASSSVWLLDSLLEYVVLELPSMFSLRAGHGVVFYDGYIYAIGGCTITGNQRTCLSSSERFSIKGNAWENLEDLPKAVAGISPIVHKGKIYAFGGTVDGDMTIFEEATDCTNAIQVLDLDSLSWKQLELCIPENEYWIPCFHAAGKLFFINGDQIYRFEEDSYTVTGKADNAPRNFGGPCFYIGTTLVCAGHVSPASQYEILKDSLESPQENPL
mmetsp:Transcript_19107/g.34775  ORF Transcript_19107/g.34775 Transcript_19107/m.34775 type:complete len:281 (-) Transcript_19107:1536-2378(-)